MTKPLAMCQTQKKLQTFETGKKLKQASFLSTVSFPNYKLTATFWYNLCYNPAILAVALHR